MFCAFHDELTCSDEHDWLNNQPMADIHRRFPKSRALSSDESY